MVFSWLEIWWQPILLAKKSYFNLHENIQLQFASDADRTLSSWKKSLPSEQFVVFYFKGHRFRLFFSLFCSMILWAHFKIFNHNPFITLTLMFMFAVDPCDSYLH